MNQLLALPVLMQPNMLLVRSWEVLALLKSCASLSALSLFKSTSVACTITDETPFSKYYSFVCGELLVVP